MAHIESTADALDAQQSDAILELQSILDTAERFATALLDRLNSYRSVGRKGYSPRSMFRACVARYFLRLKSVNELHRLLENNREVLEVCGLPRLPHRTTFNRFIFRMSQHWDLVDACMVRVVEELRTELPGLGGDIALDSTLVRSLSNPNRKDKKVTDPDASWGVRSRARTREDQEEWIYGYKYHAAVDADYGIPMVGMVTRASGNDFPHLEPPLRRLQEAYPGIEIKHVVADRGYDSLKNNQLVLDIGASPIIGIRNMLKEDELYEGVYTFDGIPTCMGKKPMEYVRSDPQRGHLYRCPPEGCHLKNRKGVLYCQDEDWENRQDNPRMWPPIRRGSPEYKRMSRKRWLVEQVFKSLLESRGLEVHYVRGVDKIALHCLLGTLVYCVTALVRIQNGEREYMRWQVRRVA